MGNASPTYSVAGTVYRDRSDERLDRAVITGQSAGRPTRTVITDDDGDFTLPDLEQGTWTFTALHEESRATSLRPMAVTENKSGVDFRLSRLMSTRDEAGGKAFFNGLCVSLLLLALIYVFLHSAFPPTPETLSPTVVAMIASAQEDAQRADDLSTSIPLTTTVADIKSSVSSLVTSTVALSDEERQMLGVAAVTVARAQDSIRANNKEATLASLRSLRAMLEKPRSESFFWNQEPWRTAEVLMWGLAGILARLIMTVGSYLRWGRFYREGMFLHWAQLITIPLLVMVVVLLLSLATLTLTLSGETEVSFDLRDPRLLAAVSFLIGIGPWSVWKFVGDTSNRLLGRSDPDSN